MRRQQQAFDSTIRAISSGTHSQGLQRCWIPTSDRPRTALDTNYWSGRGRGAQYWRLLDFAQAQVRS